MAEAVPTQTAEERGCGGLVKVRMRPAFQLSSQAFVRMLKSHASACLTRCAVIPASEEPTEQQEQAVAEAVPAQTAEERGCGGCARLEC